MSSANFHSECFRPWKPPQEKVHPFNICRYPSPVSISATPSPSDPTVPTSQSQKSYAPKFEKHPLPVRPPAEVCVNSGLQLNAQITQLESEVLGQTPSLGPIHEIFDLEGSSLHSHSLPRSDNLDHTMILDRMVQDPEDPLPNIVSGDLEYACTPDQYFRVGVLGSPIRTGAFPNSATIDPAILGASHSRDVEQIQATETTSGLTTLPDRFSAEPSRSLDEDAHFDGRRHNSKGSGRHPSRISKVSVVVERRTKNRVGCFTNRLGAKEVSFSTVRAQFSALPVEDRLQFLSWLFQGALSQCLQIPSGTKDTSASTCVSGQDKVSTPMSEHPSMSAETADVECPRSSRKGLKWSAEEDQLLVKLREEEGLAWPEVTKRFCRVFSGRKQGSIQVYWSTKLSKRQLSLAKK